MSSEGFDGTGGGGFRGQGDGTGGPGRAEGRRGGAGRAEGDNGGVGGADRRDGSADGADHHSTDHHSTDHHSTDHHSTDVPAYAAEVRAQFTDLSAEDSADLLEELEDHLREVAAEGAGTLRERLGAPAEYARELRQAAGLPEPGEGSGSGSRAEPRRTLRSRARQAMADAERRARRHRAGREVLDFLPSLRPAWWVLRGWAAVQLLEAVTTNVDPWHDFALIPRVGNSTFIGLLALLVAIPASVYASRQTVPAGWRRRAMGAGEGLLVLFTVGMALSSIDGQGAYADQASGVSYDRPAQSGLVEAGRPISNLYVYDQSGKLLNGVYVYDQNGLPVSTAPFADGPFIDGDDWLDENGLLVTNFFPHHLLEQRWSPDGDAQRLVAVPPPVVTVPRGLHQRPGFDDSQQGSATPSVTLPTPGPTAATPSGTPLTSTSASPPTTASGGATGAQTTSALPTTPAPSGTKG